MTHHVVYRMFDANGRLLYVGCTADMPRRLDQHRSSKPWWADVDTIRVEHFATKDHALAAELAATHTEGALHNADLSSAAIRGHANRKAARERWHSLGRSCNDAGCGACRARLRARQLGIPDPSPEPSEAA